MHFGFFSTAAVLDLFELLPRPDSVGKLLNNVREANDFVFMSVTVPISIVMTNVIRTNPARAFTSDRTRRPVRVNSR